MILASNKNKCDICSNEFTKGDSYRQTISCVCIKCNKTVYICTNCKKKSCSCGGVFFDFYHKNPDKLI